MKKVYTAVISLLLMFSNINAYAYSKDDYTSKINEIKQLIEQCTEKNIAADYENVAYNTLCMFQNYLEEDIENNVAAEQLQYNEAYLEQLYLDTKYRLSGYLSGELQAEKPVGKNEAAGRGINGKLFTDKDGYPIISTGYGHFGSVAAEAEKLQGIGADNMAIEMGPIHISKATDICGWRLAGGNYGSFERTASAEREGYLLKIINSGNGECSIEQTVPVEAGAKYIVSICAKADNRTLCWFENSSQRKIIETEWAEYSWEVTAQADFYNVLLGISSQTTGLYLDNIQIKKDGSEENILLNGDFEKGKGYYFKNQYSYVTDALEKAGQNNIAVNLLITSAKSYMPDFIFELYPEACNINPGYYNTFGYIINHKEMLEYLTESYKFIAHMVKSYPALNSIIIANEPRYETLCAPQFYNPLFRKYMSEVYDDIDALNLCCNTDYNSFDEVTMPESMEYTPLGYDWVSFNENMTAEFFKSVSEAVKSSCSKPISIKIENPLIFQSYETSQKYLRYGINIEKLNPYFDIAGCDNYCVYNWKETRSDTMAWYDMLGSLTGKPIYNSEEHVIPDADEYFGPEQAEYVRYNLWQGAVHGKTMSSLWSYYRTYDSSKVLYNALLHRPDCIFEAGKTALQLREYSSVIAEIINKKYDAAMLYSKASRVYSSKEYAKSFTNAYKAAVNAGIKTGFVTEENISKLDDYKILIIPNVQYTSAEAVEGIKKFIDNGGITVMLNSAECLKYDEHMNENDISAVNYIVENSICSTTLSLGADLAGVNEFDVRLLNSEENAVSDFDWQYVYKNGKYYVNICNIGTSDAEIQIICNNKRAEKVYDELTGKFLNSLTAEVNKPMLISFEAKIPVIDFDILSVSGEKDFSAEIKSLCSESYTVTAAFVLRDNEGNIKSVSANTRCFEPDEIKKVTAGFSELSKDDTVSIEIWKSFTERNCYKYAVIPIL